MTDGTESETEEAENQRENGTVFSSIKSKHSTLVCCVEMER